MPQIKVMKSVALLWMFNETSTFTSLVTHETYKINHQFECNEKCSIYLITWKQYLEQYVGHLFRPFSSMNQNGILNNASVTFTDKTDSTNLLKNFEKNLENYGRMDLILTKMCD